MVGNPEDRFSRCGLDNFCDPVSFPQIDIFFSSYNERVEQQSMFQTF